MADTLQNWIEWKQKCALDACSPETQQALRGFLAEVAYSYGGFDDKSLDPWHELEVYALVPGPRGRKPSKDWLFDYIQREEMRGRDDWMLWSLRQGVWSVMRTVMETHEPWRREGSRPRNVSLNAPEGGHERGEGAALTLQDLLPGHHDTGDEAGSIELQRFAHPIADRLFKQLKRHEKVAMAAACLGVPLSNGVVLDVARREKSVVCGSIKKVEIAINKEASREFPKDDDETKALLGRFVFCNLKVLCCEWAKSEIKCARLFTIRGHREDYDDEC
jgi:hypothetical protein